MPIRELVLRAASVAMLPLLPLVFLQGRRVRRHTPRLPGAGGPDRGRVPGMEPALRLLVVGESTVEGVGAGTHDEALTGRVAARLAERTGRAVAWRAVGRSGASARTVHRLLLPGIEAEPVDLVVIALGVNDVLQLRPAGGWEQDLGALIAALRERVGPAPVVLAPVPPMHRFPALPQPLRVFLGTRARVLDHAAARLARGQRDVLHAGFHLDPAADGFFCQDGFHPSVLGYRTWAGQLVDQALPWLARRG